jgi:hypothetical protein
LFKTLWQHQSLVLEPDKRDFTERYRGAFGGGCPLVEPFFCRWLTLLIPFLITVTLAGRLHPPHLVWDFSNFLERLLYSAISMTVSIGAFLIFQRTRSNFAEYL